MSNRTKTADTVDCAALQLAEVIKRYDELERMDPEKGTLEDTYQRAEMKDVYWRGEALVDYITTQKAQTLDGVLVQMALAVHFFNWLEAMDLDRPGREETEHRFRCLMYSAASMLSTIVDTDALSRLIERYMGPHQNPWKTSDERIAYVEAERDKAA